MTFSALITSAATRTSFIVWFLFCVVASIGFGQLKFAADYTSYFSDDNAQFNRFKSFQREFVQRDELILIVESPQDEDIKQHLPFITDLTTALSQLPFVQNTGGFTPDNFNKLSSALPRGNQKNPALEEFVAKDNSAVLLSLAFTPHQAVPEFLNQINTVKSLINTQIAQYDLPIVVNYTGELTLNWQYAEVIKHDLMWFLPCLILLLAVMLFFIVPEKWWIVGIASSSLVTLLCTIGLAAWGHFTIAAISGFVPVIIMVLNVAYSMHLYFDWRNDCRQQHLQLESDIAYQSMTKLDAKNIAFNALINAMTRNFQPLLWGAVTTAFGFILLRFSPSPPIQDFGAMVAFAVIINLLSNYTILVAFARLALYKKTSKGRLYGVCEYLYQLSWRLRRPILTLIVLLSLVATASLTLLRFDDDAANYFPSDNPFSQSNRIMEQKFNGVNQLNFVADTKVPFGVTTSDYIKNINQFSRFLVQQDEVINTRSVVDWLKWYGIGQYKFKQLLTENTTQALGAEKLINADSSASLLRVNLIPMKASQLIDFETKVITYLEKTGLNNVIQPPLGQQLIFAHLSRENSWTMLSSFSAALILLFTLLLFLKRSFKLALLGLLANVLPLVFVFGFWQMIGGSLSLGSAVVMGMILGIIIDDSLHLLLKVNADKQTLKNEDPTLACFSAVMPAITFTSVLLMVGFSLGLKSDFFPIIELSILSLLTLFMAWLFDFIVLPICYRLALGANSNE